MRPFPSVALTSKLSVLALALAVTAGGCARREVVYVREPAPAKREFGDAQRPALAAALNGVEAAQPGRADVGSSWVKRHLALEKNRTPALVGAAAPSSEIAPSITSYAARETRRRIDGPSKILSPDDFDPNRIF
jgi:hypothetical protein